ncbi:hypothetical protein TVAG_266760 [Trichomonas vaginalis G3]|uniref:Uncharacterized protein n=1 Tax=Trichomonas vaginalis (strain ATCC PRA-98 / G3) TaxID=412133 RepID=A2DQM9_TRIV3|nr:glycoprotein 38 family [Trichomonas vaginalis G3]EAY17313.1 hypothetical protein TVAG_266760 [Trichomonas vaginalis G3]KAI5515675.1 glycoprotein 38 family [Trichomonas vaginalis G3]|eukprot:XP_001329536.1 hypothetical protein [Trichomonas vaginalis G3]
MMLLLFLAKFAQQAIRCDEITKLLEFNQPISLTCTGLTDQAYLIKFYVNGLYIDNYYGYTGNVTGPNTITVTVTDIKPFTLFQIIEVPNYDSDFINVKFNSNPQITVYSFAGYSGQWNQFSFGKLFAYDYYEKGRESYRFALTQNTNVNEDIFQENSLQISNEYLHNVFIPSSVQEGDYYIVGQLIYIDEKGVTKKSSLSYSPLTSIVKSNNSNQFSVKKQDEQKTFIDSIGRLEISYEAYPTVPYAKIMSKIGGYSEDISLYEDQIDITNIYYGRDTFYISNSLYEIEHSITFILVDTSSSQILNHTEIEIDILPKIAIKSHTIDHPKDTNDRYLLLPEEFITGTITLQNQIPKEFISVSDDRDKLIGNITEIPGESKKFAFSIKVNLDDYSWNILRIYFNVESDSDYFSLHFSYLKMEINVNHCLPKSGTIGGNINIIISNADNLHLKIVGKIGQYESMISSYIEIDSRESDHDFSIDLANKITYNTEETLPTQATFALLYNDAIITHKTIDFLILEPPEIESITLSGTTQEFATNSRMTFIIKIIKADLIEDSSLKFEFAESGVSDMSNPTIVNTYKPVKVSNTENDYMFVLIVPNNVAPGQKNLLVKILDTIGQESSLFIIPVTITQGRQITESSISCHKTQDMMPDNSEQMFKCNIDNIESNPVYYKAKVDTHIDSDYEQYDLDVRMEEIGNENEFNVYVTIPVQNEEKMSFSFAMISSNENTIIKYSDVSDIKIVPSPKIRQTSYDTFNVEKYSKMEFQFRLDYICEFESMKAQYKDSASNSEFQNVISKSALREINYYGYLYNAFYVTANI